MISLVHFGTSFRFDYDNNFGKAEKTEFIQADCHDLLQLFHCFNLFTSRWQLGDISA